MAFNTAVLAADEALVIDHRDGLVRIRIRDANNEYRSAMAIREGADDFMVSPGACDLSYSAQRACRMTVYWRNRYL